MKTLRITLEGKTYDVAVEVLGENAAAVSSVPASVPVPAPVPVQAAAPAPAPAAPTAAAPSKGAGSVLCPMAGQVMKIKVAIGQTVSINQEVLILEAMKMETPIPTPVAGSVLAINVKEGDVVSEGQVLIEIG